jgi:MFS family permease
MTIQASAEGKIGRWAMGRPSNLTLLYCARAARGFGDGFAVIILPAYLAELGFTPLEIGIVATSALLGTAVLTLAVGHLAARFNLRNLLLISAFVMIATGMAFENRWHECPAWCRRS